MKQLFPVCLVVLFLHGAALRAGPAETAIMAAMRLSDQPNYSWVATVQDDARTYDITGKTEKGGFTHAKMPVINSVRRRLGRGVTDTQLEVIFRGNVDCVLETEKGWLKPHELPAADEPEYEEPDNPAPIGDSVIPRAPSGGLMKGAIIRRRTPRTPPREERHYSNLQLGISHPHEELGVIVGSHIDFNVEGDTVTGSLTALGAQLLLVRDGQKDITPGRAAGTFKLWVRDGLVMKYQVKLEGVLMVDTPAGRREILVHQTTNTTVKDIGTTKFEVPAEARRKLGT